MEDDALVPPPNHTPHTDCYEIIHIIYELLVDDLSLNGGHPPFFFNRYPYEDLEEEVLEEVDEGSIFDRDPNAD